MKRLLLLLILSVCGFADSITYNTISFTTPGFAQSSSNDVTLNTTSGQYSVAAEFCESLYCASSSNAGESSLLRLTGLTIVCTGVTSCGPLLIGFEADGPSLSSPRNANADLTLDGTATETVTGSATVCVTSSTAICSSNLSGPQSLSTSFVLSTSGTVATPQFGFMRLDATSSVLGQLSIDNLDGGNSISFTDGLDFGYTLLVGAPRPTPEPSSFVLAALGLALCGIARNRLHSSPRDATRPR